MNEQVRFSEEDFDLVNAALHALKEKSEKLVEFAKEGFPGHPLQGLYKVITSDREGASLTKQLGQKYEKQLEDITILSGKLVQMRRQHRQQPVGPNDNSQA
jgi:hypothetical protein